jgi:hypothetical protein
VNLFQSRFDSMMSVRRWRVVCLWIARGTQAAEFAFDQLQHLLVFHIMAAKDQAVRREPMLQRWRNASRLNFFTVSGYPESAGQRMLRPEPARKDLMQQIFRLSGHLISSRTTPALFLTSSDEFRARTIGDPSKAMGIVRRALWR